MTFRKTGSPYRYFQARLRNGQYRQLSTRARKRFLADRIALMWEVLAVEYRAWDLLEPVLEGALSIGELYDLYEATGRNPDAMRRRRDDRDLTPLVEEWHGVYARKHPDTDSPAHALAHVRVLLPEGKIRKVSEMTVQTLTKALYEYEGAPATLRKVHSSWSGFFDYCVRVRGLFPFNPLSQVEKPKLRKQPLRFYELEAAQQIVEAQPDPARRALFALLYGTGMEVSVALRLTRADLDPANREVRAAGTKTHTRDRMARIADWAWPLVWEYGRGHLPTARLWPERLTRFTVSDWHRETVKGLGLPPHPLKNARHHWAVRMLRSGAPIAVVQAQLGHATAKLTLDTYGAFLPLTEDRARAEQQATKREKANTRGGI